MARKLKITGRAMSMPAGLLTGLAVSVGITILGTAIIAKMLDTEKLREGLTGYAVMAVLLVSSFAGTLISCRKVKRQYLVVCGVSAMLYFLVLLGITALFFGGQYEAVGVSGLLVLCGSILALMTGGQGRRGGKR